MDDRPTAAELIEAARLFLERELLPTLGDARLRFQTLVAANALAIAGRDLAGEARRLRDEWALLNPTAPPPGGLAELREAVRRANDELCQRIRAGEFDDPERFRELLGLARRQIAWKLEAANPRALARPRGFV
jgi:hypothetical protein